MVHVLQWDILCTCTMVALVLLWDIHMYMYYGGIGAYAGNYIRMCTCTNCTRIYNAHEHRPHACSRLTIQLSPLFVARRVDGKSTRFTPLED